MYVIVLTNNRRLLISELEAEYFNLHIGGQELNDVYIYKMSDNISISFTIGDIMAIAKHGDI